MKNYVITAIVASVITAFCFHAYTVYEIKKEVMVQGQAIQQIVNFINSKTVPSESNAK